MNKHKPVLLNEVLSELDSLIQTCDEITAIDCTLGQAGHSLEIFKKIKRGVLVSIDLDADSIKWVVENIKLENTNFKLETKNNLSCYCLKVEDSSLKFDKTWYLVQSDFADFDYVAKALDIQKYDFILADLGFSNYQLTLNLGISYDNQGQLLDMRYERQSRNDQDTISNNQTEQSITARDVLNEFDASELERIFVDYGQIENPKALVNEIIQKRKEYPIERVRDLLRILNKDKYPKNYKVKAFQALRSFVNKEIERLNQFLDKVPKLLSKEGKALVISFNSLEEQIIEQEFRKSEYKSLEPNITEIISNPQSRSAKLHIFKKTQ